MAFGNDPWNTTDPTGTTPAGNPLNGLFGGGYSGGKIGAAPSPILVSPTLNYNPLGSLFGPVKTTGNSNRSPSGTLVPLAFPNAVNNPRIDRSLANDLSRIQTQQHFNGVTQSLQEANRQAQADAARNRLSRPAAPPGYWDNVGEVFKGYGDAIVGTTEGLYNVVRHPINTAQGIATAVRHPILTSQVIINDYSEKSQTLRGQDAIVGDVLTGLATGGVVKATKEAGLIGKVTNKLQGLLNKTDEAQDAQAIVAKVAQQQANSGLRKLGKHLSLDEQLEYAQNPAAGSRYLGKAVHEATAEALKKLYPGRFEYNRIGPDFRDALTRELIELTTPGQVAAHIAKGGAYVAAKYATYILPKK
jgi:hypothetical protein